MLDSPWVRLVNNWVHDFASGLWGSCVFVMWLIGVELGKDFEGAPAVLERVRWTFWWVLLAALAVIALTGAVRLSYWRRATPTEELPAKRPALIGKHVVFLAVYGLGTWWAWALL